MEVREFASCMTMLGIAYNKEFNESQLKVWYSFFKEADIVKFKVAIKTAILEEEYIPSIATVNRHLEDVEFLGHHKDTREYKMLQEEQEKQIALKG